jgi:hypothetical protein
MGGSLCCFASTQEEHSLKGSEFHSESTCAPSAEPDESLDGRHKSQKDFPNGWSSIEQYRDIKISDYEIYLVRSCGKQRIRNNTESKFKQSHKPISSLRAFVGLTPINEEDSVVYEGTGSPKPRYYLPPRDLSKDSSVSEDTLRQTKFLSYGSMKHYQRFVKSN